jgi:hypothetical protein
MSKFTLEVMDPRGVLADPAVVGLKVPRVTDLDGKKIALLSEKPDSDLFFNAMESLLKNSYPAAEILRLPSPANPFLPDNTAEVASICDVWLQGVKTSTSSRIDYDARMEMHGKPGAMFSVDALVKQKRCVAEINGLPTLRVISLPSLDYFKAKADQKLMAAVAENAFGATIKALTAPLTEEEKYPEQFSYDYSAKKFSEDSYDKAFESFNTYFTENGMTDGLPVVPPTREAVGAMLAGTSYPPDKEIGIVLPREGIATVEKIAVNAVMAGAKPEYLPVIIAIVECFTDKNFNQNHINTGPMPVTWISGPIIDELGINNDIAYLSPGNRANSTIARACALCQINIGWRLLDVYADPGGPGTPANYTNYFIPENLTFSPWDSYAADNGFGAGDSVVSVSEHTHFMRGPSETLYYGSFDESMRIMRGFFKPSSMYFAMGLDVSRNARYLIVLHPTFADQLKDAGYTKESFVQWLYDKNAVIWDKMCEEERGRFLAEVQEGGWPGLKPEHCKPGMKLEPFSDAKHVAVIVAGNPTGTTIVYATGTGSTAKMGDCAPDFVPRPFMIKKVSGAALTKYGK